MVMSSSSSTITIALTIILVLPLVWFLVPWLWVIGGRVGTCKATHWPLSTMPLPWARI